MINLNNNPKVSIVLPTYNHAKYLPKAVQSIFAQTCEDYELIIVDDGSTDQTEAVLSQIKNSKVRLISKKNQGLPAALNTGFAVANGTYWTWTSADNIVGPTWLEELVNALDAAPLDVGYALSSFANINDKGQLINVDNNQSFETHSMFLRNGNASFLYRSALAKQVGVYDEELNGAEDLDMWIRMSLITRAVHVESVLYYYRLHEESMTAMIPEKITIATRKMIDKFVASCKGTLDIDRVFRGIAKSKDPELSRWQAQVWLAARLSQSSFWPVSYIVDLLVAALVKRYEASLVGNIVNLYAKHDAWGPAAEVVSTCLTKDPSPFLRGLAELVVNRNKAAIAKIPFVTIPDANLAFDLKTQLSRNESIRKAG